jgi:hypothetical protein
VINFTSARQQIPVMVPGVGVIHLIADMKERTVQILVHILIWSAFLLFLLIFIPFYDIKLLEMPLYFFGMTAILIGYYYFNSLILVPVLFARGRFWSFALVTFLILLLYLYLSDKLDWMQPPPQHSFREYPAPPPPGPFSKNKQYFMPPRERPGTPVTGNETSNNVRQRKFPTSDPRIKIPLSSTLIFILIFMVSTGTRVISYWFESERNRIRAEKEKSVAELSALKAQINPHFLFNVLNSIYFLSRKKSDATPEVILKLSDLMRFLLTETTAGYIPLEKEVESIRQYIDLQKLRLTEKTKIIFETIGEAGNLSIAPLLLLPFVENAFKYGVSSHRHSEIMISLTMMQDRLMFMVKNGKAGTPVSEKSTGTGLKNVVRRLNLTYPDKHALKIGETETGYVVELKIILT